ncbi:hypothetical protein P4O66_015093 [Electrophorus voltai]|uniref:Uncharacterized protein n=1 Tax=Electrophorus voltai TaxID=2609070 RepID=A0AAD8YY74_9TELE|nr:hypothetical protein P4O66_015093 [Electrophorus voltai]
MSEFVREDGRMKEKKGVKTVQWPSTVRKKGQPYYVLQFWWYNSPHHPISKQMSPTPRERSSRSAQRRCRKQHSGMRWRRRCAERLRASGGEASGMLVVQEEWAQCQMTLASGNTGLGLSTRGSEGSLSGNITPVALCCDGAGRGGRIIALYGDSKLRGTKPELSAFSA